MAIRLTSSTRITVMVWRKPARKASFQLVNFHWWLVEYFIILKPIIKSSCSETCITKPQMNRATIIHAQRQLGPQASSDYSTSVVSVTDVFRFLRASHMTRTERTLWIMNRTVTLPSMLVLNCSSGSSSSSDSIWETWSCDLFSYLSASSLFGSDCILKFCYEA